MLSNSLNTTLVAAAQTEADYIAVLKSDASRFEKAEACRMLARVGTKEAVPVLVGLLDDPELAHMARNGLEPNPDPSVDEALRDALGKLKGLHLVGVIGSVGVRRDAKALDTLAGFLKDSDPQVAQAAARSLGRIGSFTAVTSLDRARAGVPEATLLAFCEGAFRCAEALSAKGKNGEAETIYDRMRGLQVPHQVKAGALRGLILVRKKDGMKLLLEALRGEDYAMAEAAARTAMEIPGPEATKALADEVAKLPADRQVLAIQALGKRADAEALPSLFAAAKSGDKDVRVAAIKAFPEIGDAKAVAVLKELAEDSDGKVSKAAKESLAALPS